MKPLACRRERASQSTYAALGALATAAALGCTPWLAGCGAAKSEPKVPKEQRLERLHQRSEAVADELEALGFPLRRENITVTLGGGSEDRPPRENLGGFGPFQNPYSRSNTRPFLFAYYLPTGKRVVFQERTELWLENPDNTVAHELAHAYQDQFQGGLAEYQRTHSKSNDSAISMKSLLEGEATLIAEGLRLRRHGVDLGQLDRAVEGDGVGQFRSDGFGSPYTVGRNFLLAQYRTGGWAAVRQAFRQPPSSSEQLLNPDKYGRDFGRHVSLPEWPNPEEPVRLAGNDVVGELGIFQQLAWALQEADDLALSGVLRARRAALGWDGDRVNVFRHVDGESVMLWRTVWDTASEAEAFAQTVLVAAGEDHEDYEDDLSIRRDSHVVDIVTSEDETLRLTGAQALANHPFEFEQNAEDIRSTEEAIRQLEALPQTLPTVTGQLWNHPLSQLSVGIPEKWEVRVKLRGIRPGVQTLFGDIRHDYEPTAEVSQKPDLFHGDALAQAKSLLEEIRQSSLPVLKSSVSAVPGPLRAARVQVLIEESDDEVEAAYWLVPRQGHVFQLRILHRPDTTPWVVDYFDHHLSAFGASPGPAATASVR